MTPQKMSPDRVRRFLTPLLVLTVVLPAFAQVTDKAATPATEKPAVVSKDKDSKTLELSPFTVTTTKDNGYFAENTLMGSRLNSNLADLAASITVVTKQQLEDTGALDINDVFMYEANTEGAATYTPSYNNRGVLRDGISGYSADDGQPFGIATANRVRGLAAADTAENNYPTIQRLAFDSYNTNSVEISRGSNSMLFGTGGASGIVNQSAAEAVLGKEHTQVQLRGGSFDAWRASFNTNIPVGDKLAIYIAGLYDSRGFERKPSSDVYRRQYGAVTFQPFRRTKITASYENYDNYNNRPNFNSPLDLVTPWRNALSPTWDPTTQMITFSDGTSKGPFLLSARDARFVNTTVTPVGNGVIDSGATLNGAIVGTTQLYVPSLTFASANRQRLYVDNGQVVGYWADATLAGGAATTGTRGAEHTVPTDAGLGSVDAFAGVETVFSFPITGTGSTGKAFGLTAPVAGWCSALKPASPDTKVLGPLKSEQAPGLAFLTERKRGKGAVVVLGALPDGQAGQKLLAKLVAHYAAQAGVTLRFNTTPGTLVCPRVTTDGKKLWVVVNLDGKGGRVRLPAGATDALTGKKLPTGPLKLARYGWRTVRF